MSPKYSISYARWVAKDIDKIPYHEMMRIFDKIEALASEELWLDIKKMRWYKEDTYRLRVWDYRVIYRKNGDILTILVLEIWHRKDIYD